MKTRHNIAIAFMIMGFIFQSEAIFVGGVVMFFVWLTSPIKKRKR